MTFKIHEQNEVGEFTVYDRSFDSLEELMHTIDEEWWWAKVTLSATFDPEITLTFDESEWAPD